VATVGLILDIAPQGKTVVPAPKLPNLQTGGFTIAFWLQTSDSSPNQMIVDGTINTVGLTISVAKIGNTAELSINLFDGSYPATWHTDRLCGAQLFDGKQHHVGFVVDGGPKIISVTVDDMLCDGGSQWAQGWTYFPPLLNNINNAANWQLAPSFNGKLLHLRVYDRYLLTTELIGNWRSSM